MRGSLLRGKNVGRKEKEKKIITISMRLVSVGLTREKKRKNLVKMFAKEYTIYYGGVREFFFEIILRFFLYSSAKPVKS